MEKQLSIQGIEDTIKDFIGKATGTAEARDVEAGKLDATEVLASQHREVEELFAEIEDLGDDATRTKERLAEKLIEKLSLHATLEEKFFYPAAREASDDLVDEAAEEHFNVKSMLKRLGEVSGDDDKFDARVKVLKELVNHHVKEEEHELFPKCREVMGMEKLRAIGAKIQEATDRHEKAPVAKAKRGRKSAH